MTDRLSGHPEVTREPPFSSIIRDFHRLYYNSEVWKRTYWRSVPVAKCPLDLWVYQEMLFELRPKLIIELGSWLGGSALFFASMLDFIGEGKVVSVDVEDRARPNHARIQYLIGSSTSTEVITRIEEIAHEAGPPVIVIADSDHRRVHVAKELEAYASLVTVGSYFVVEDTNINGHPVLEGWGEGPREAVLEFLSRHPEFEPDYQREKLFLSFNPGGYLRRLL